MYGESKKPCNECAAEDISFCLGCPNSDYPNKINEVYGEESRGAEQNNPSNKVYKIKNKRGMVILIPLIIFSLTILLFGEMTEEERIKLVLATTFLVILLFVFLAFVPSYVVAEITDKYIRTFKYDKKKKKACLSGFVYWDNVDGCYYDKFHYINTVTRLSPDELYIFTKYNRDIVISNYPRLRVIPKLKRFLGKPGISYSTGEKIKVY